MKNRVALTLILLTGMGIASCKKSTDYVPQPYACACGSMKWGSGTFELLDANYILADSTVDLSRRYYVTADVGVPGQAETESVSMTLEIADVGEGLFYVDESQQEFIAQIYYRNDGDALRPQRLYRPTQGVVQVNPAFLGGMESIRFNLIVREVDENNNFIGFEIPFSGSFRLDIDVY